MRLKKAKLSMKAYILLQVLLCNFWVFSLWHFMAFKRLEGPCIPPRTGMSEAMER